MSRGLALRGSAVAVALLVGAAASSIAGAADKAPRSSPRVKVGALPTPDYLPEEARLAVNRKMQRHGQDAVELMMAVTLLQYDVAEAAAQRIATEPRLARPVAGGEDDVNAALPERFFVLQDEVRLRAEQLRAAAEKKDDKELARALGQLTTTCVGCHSAYLRP